MQGRQRRVNEDCSAYYTATVRDDEGNAIAGDDLDSLKLTLYVADTSSDADGDILNSRDGQDVLGQNNVTVDANGLLTWEVQPADNVIAGTNIEVGKYEKHIALFEWAWNSSEKHGNQEVEIFVKQLAKVE